MKISDLTAKIINGDYPDIERPDDERVILCNDQITQYYSTILGTLLFNNVPAERAEATIPKRIRMFDDIMRAINVLRIGRLNCLLEELDHIVEESRKDKDIWLSKKSANNICTFITEFWAWPDQVRVDFINGTEEVDIDDLDVEYKLSEESDSVESEELEKSDSYNCEDNDGEMSEDNEDDLDHRLTE